MVTVDVSVTALAVAATDDVVLSVKDLKLAPFADKLCFCVLVFIRHDRLLGQPRPDPTLSMREFKQA